MKEKRFFLLQDYPECPYTVGAVLSHKGEDKEPNFEKYPHLFKPLKWWEKRSLDELCSVKFCRIVKTNGYWREGDILPVIGYDINSSGLKPEFNGYRLKGYNIDPERYKKEKVEPATKEEFLAWKEKNKISITP